MPVTPSGIVTLAGHTPFISYNTLPNITRPSGRLLRNGVFENAYSPMLVTLSGIITLESLLQPENA